MPHVLLDLAVLHPAIMFLQEKVSLIAARFFSLAGYMVNTYGGHYIHALNLLLEEPSLVNS